MVACGSFLDSATPATDGGADADVDVRPGTEAGGGDGAIGTDAADASDGDVPPVAPTVLASGLQLLSGIAVTDSTVYVSEREVGDILAVPIGGGPVSQFAPPAGAPTGLAVSDGFLFWCDFGGGRILRRLLSGGTVTASPPTPMMSSFQLAAAPNQIVSVALGPTNLGQVQQFSTATLTAGPFVGPLLNPYDVAVFGGQIYFTESSGARIGQGAIGDATNVEVATGEADPQSIAADASGVYWARPLISAIRAKASAAGAGVVTLVTGEMGPHSLAADGTSLYWLTSDGKVRRRSHATGVIKTLASGFATTFADAHVQGLALTPTYVVWITADGFVMRAPK